MKTILIADDDEQLVELLAIRCRHLGLHPVVTDNALDALLRLRQDVFDFAILDIGMPNGNGLDVLEMIAGEPALRGIPTIILTGRSDPQTIRRCHRLLGYYVQKGGQVWSRVEPLLREWMAGAPPVTTNQASHYEGAPAQAAPRNG